MRTVEELRERGVEAQPVGEGSFSLLATAIGAFAIGAILVLGWTMRPQLASMATAMFGSSGPRLDFGSNRVGNAENASALKLCVPRQMLEMSGPNGPLEAAHIYRILRMGGAVSTLSAVAGQPQNVVDPLVFALTWGQLADCVYRQSGRVMCEPDNRALAVEAIETFLRQFGIAANHTPSENSFTEVIAKVQGGDKYVRTRGLQEAGNIKDRVLRGLRSQLQQGRLIAGDFGFFVSGDVGKIAGEVKPQRNACADERA